MVYNGPRSSDHNLIQTTLELVYLLDFGSLRLAVMPYITRMARLSYVALILCFRGSVPHQLEQVYLVMVVCLINGADDQRRLVERSRDSVVASDKHKWCGVEV